MKRVDIAEAETRLDDLIDDLTASEEIVIFRDNQPVARLLPVAAPEKNRTQLGWARGEGTILDDLQGPFLEEQA